MWKKCDLSDLECGMVVGARLTGLSIFQKVLIYFHTPIMSRVYREWSEKEKISSEWQFSGWKCLVDGRCHRRMAGLVRADRKATVSQISTWCNWGDGLQQQDTILLSAENRKRATISTGSTKMNNVGKMLPDLISAATFKVQGQFSFHCLGHFCLKTQYLE